jgi:hypothetical protein
MLARRGPIGQNDSRSNGARSGNASPTNRSRQGVRCMGPSLPGGRLRLYAVCARQALPSGNAYSASEAVFIVML